MLSKKIQAELNKQLNRELHSSYLYLAMAAYFEAHNFTGFAKWMRIQSQEEYDHAMRFYNYIVHVGGRVSLAGIQEPAHEWKSPADAFAAALKHEEYITDSINNLTTLAKAEKDHASDIFLHWFVEEQVEEVATATRIVEQFKLVGDNKASLFLLDRELSKRGDDKD